MGPSSLARVWVGPIGPGRTLRAAVSVMMMTPCRAHGPPPPRLWLGKRRPRPRSAPRPGRLARAARPRPALVPLSRSPAHCTLYPHPPAARRILYHPPHYARPPARPRIAKFGELGAAGRRAGAHPGPPAALSPAVRTRDAAPQRRRCPRAGMHTCWHACMLVRVAPAAAAAAAAAAPLCMVSHGVAGPRRARREPLGRARAPAPSPLLAV